MSVCGGGRKHREVWTCSSVQNLSRCVIVLHLRLGAVLFSSPLSVLFFFSSSSFWHPTCARTHPIQILIWNVQCAQT
uniref:Uncharacterized protein n=1 Tax=Anguilla anguilla TaxID=7936 RepID=A0A0E9SSI1_ANGAN